MNKRVIYISHDGLTDSLGESQVLSYILELEKKGVSYDVISFEKKNNKEKIKRVKELIDKKNIKWHQFIYYNKPFVLGTVYNLVQLYFLLFYLITLRNPNFIHSRGYLMSFVAISLKIILGVKVVFDMRGFWIDEKIESNSWNGFYKKPLLRLLRFLEKYSFRAADSIIALTHASRLELVNKFKVCKNKIEVIPTCVNEKLFFYDEKKGKELRSKFHIEPNKTILLYSGSIGGYYDFDEMINIFIELKKIKENSLFFILSKIEKKFLLKKLASRNISKSDFIIDSCNIEEVYEYLCMADIGLILYNNSYSSLARCPTKMGEYIKCELKVLAPSNVGDLNYFYELDKNIGVQFSDYNSKSYEDALRLILKLKRKDVVNDFNYFDLELGVNKYLGVYENY